MKLRASRAVLNTYGPRTSGLHREPVDRIHVGSDDPLGPVVGARQAYDRLAVLAHRGDELADGGDREAHAVRPRTSTDTT